MAPTSALQLDVYHWGVPPQAVLDQAVALRTRLDAQRDTTLAPFADKMLLVVGHGAVHARTAIEIGDDGLVYLDAPDGGDGRVTLQSALLPGVRTWKLDCEHGDLPERKERSRPTSSCSTNGETTLLDALAGTSRLARRGG